MMALAAISMAVQNGAKNTDALEHYQQVIPALKIAVQSSEDSYSDGALFTHFVLLVYEVCFRLSLLDFRFRPLAVTLLDYSVIQLVIIRPLTYHRLRQQDIESITCGNITG